MTLSKRVLSLVLALSMLLATAAMLGTITASAEEDDAPLTIVPIAVPISMEGDAVGINTDIIPVYLDEAEMEFDVPAQIVNDRTMVPMRAIFEAFDAEIDWDGDTRTVTAVLGNIAIVLTIDSDTAFVDDEEFELDVPAMIIDDRTMVPLRFVSENLGAVVDWDAEERAVYITSPEPIEDEEPEEPKEPMPAWPAWDQAMVDEAVSAADISLPLDSTFQWKTSLETSEAFYILALMSFYSPNLESSKGVKVSDRLIQQIGSLVTGGREPSCQGGLGGWIDNPAAQGLVLAKNTPEVWDNLEPVVKERCDFIMQAMAVTGNVTHNYRSSPNTDMTQIYNWVKTWNPNHVEGYVGVMIAAHMYFGGAEKVNAILKDFKYDEYIAKMDEYGFVNMKNNYESTGKTLLEKGGSDALNGNFVAAKTPFTYMDILTSKELKYDPMELYNSLAKRMYYHEVQSVINNGTMNVGWIDDGSKSPYEGQIGMGFEFISMDAGGIRTSADYFMFGYRNSLVTRATLEAMGLWQGKYIDDLEARMFVGVEDFYYKIGVGYHGWSNGKDLGIQKESDGFKGMGAQYLKAIWYTAVNEETAQKELKGTFTE